MEHISEHQYSQGPPALTQLNESRGRWPSDAERAYDLLLRELNQWSRDNDWSQINNTWIAEEAVRRGWAS